jgi:hypothetical protein
VCVCVCVCVCVTTESQETSYRGHERGAAGPGGDGASVVGGTGAGVKRHSSVSGVGGRAGGVEARVDGGSGRGCEEAEMEGVGDDGEEAGELRQQLYANLVLSYLKTGDALRALEISSKVMCV